MMNISEILSGAGMITLNHLLLNADSDEFI